MVQDVLCPSCQTRITLPAAPPKTMTCAQCTTPMDLTAFGGRDEPAAAAAPAANAPGRGARSGTSRRPARRPPPRGAAAEVPRGRSGHGKSNAATWGIVGVGALLLFVVFVATKGEDEVEAPLRRGPPTREPAPVVADVPDVTPPRTPYKKRNRTRTRKGRPNVSRVKLQTFEWPEEVDGATRALAEEAVVNLYRGGRDGTEARDWLVGEGHKICGRLISEFKAIQASPGFDDREGASMASVIDGTLRRIDGFIEREWKETARIRAWGIYAAPSFIERTARRWTWWWQSEEWKTNPQTPWDPHEETDETSDGYKRPGKDSSRKGGYDKPAGSR